jgi:hypothetical protein
MPGGTIYHEAEWVKEKKHIKDRKKINFVILTIV